MFIHVVYKDVPELSHIQRRSSEPDLSLEKTLLVNPKCPIRIMLEYIRKQCRLGSFTNFDLCDEGGALLGLFNLPTYAYATAQFEHKKTYFVIVLRTEADKRISILPQVNRDTKTYEDLKARVKKYLAGEGSVQSTPTPITPAKVTPSMPTKAVSANAAGTKGDAGKKK